MLGMFSLLPFLRGWQYRTWRLEGVVQKGLVPQEITISSDGWLNSIVIGATDAYATVIFTPQHLQQAPSISIYPEWPRQLGVVLPSSTGWLVRYYRPDDVRTFGSFTILIGLESSNLPFVSPTKVQILLGDLSTEPSAFISCLAVGIELVDKSQFLNDLANLPMFKNQTDVDLAKAVGQLSATVGNLTKKVG
jgi:hypothetical protein